MGISLRYSPVILFVRIYILFVCLWLWGKKAINQKKFRGYSSERTRTRQGKDITWLFTDLYTHTRRAHTVQMEFNKCTRLVDCVRRLLTYFFYFFFYYTFPSIGWFWLFYYHLKPFFCFCVFSLIHEMKRKRNIMSSICIILLYLHPFISFHRLTMIWTCTQVRTQRTGFSRNWCFNYWSIRCVCVCILYVCVRDCVASYGREYINDQTIKNKKIRNASAYV